jgi:MscS family membrane protein
MIVLDRPFKVGDWIQVGDKVDGDVESIGLRSTKVRTWPKTIISIPNGVLANEYINNWSRMPKRRVKQVVGITYEATARDMEELVEEIRDILRKDEGVQQDFILVNFTDFGESSLDILVYYFTTTTAWLAHMDIRQRINCKIMEAVNRRGLSIAFPCRSVYLEGPAASRLAELPYASRWDAPTALPGDSGPATPP